MTSTADHARSFLIIYPYEKKKAVIRPGQTILEASIEAGINHAHACGGKAKCSTCRVIIEKGQTNCLAPSTSELLMLQRLYFPPNVRLACQTRVKGHVTLRRPVLDDIDIQVTALMTAGREPKSIGEEKPVSILFTDLARYTKFTESTQPYDLVHILNRYYFMMGKVIKRHKGQILDYYGDGFLAVFGLKNPESHPMDAVKAGLDILDTLERFNQYLKHWVNQKFQVRIGVNTGPAILGTVGLESMKKFSAFGDTVNTASRIEGANKVLRTSFLISETTYNEVKDYFLLGRQRLVSLRGKRGKHKVWEVKGTRQIRI